MVTSLDKFPPEILENIIGHLQVTEICSLRLTNRALQQKATLQSFRESFQHKHLYVTPEGLEDFNAVLQPGRLGCLLEELTLYGLAIDYDGLASTVEKGTVTRQQLSGFIAMSYEEPLSAIGRRRASSDLALLKGLQSGNQQLYSSGKAVALLAQAFKNIAINSPARQLRRLSVDVSCLADNPAKRVQPLEFAIFPRIKDIWATAAQIFQTTMSALAESDLHVEELVLFNSPSDLCSLFRDELKLLDFPRLNIFTSCLSTLSLSLSAREPILLGQEDSEFQLDTKTLDDFNGLGMLLAQCPMLKILHIHCYSSHCTRIEPIDDFIVPKFAVSGSPHSNADWELPVLEELVLAGIILREEDLLEFLRRAKPARLELDYVKVVEGTFHSIFAFCSNSNPKLEYISLSSLWEDRMLWFRVPGQCELRFDIPPSELPAGSMSFVREGVDARLPIDYYFSNAVQLRSRMNVIYWDRIRRRFGSFMS